MSTLNATLNATKESIATRLTSIKETSDRLNSTINKYEEILNKYKSSLATAVSSMTENVAILKTLDGKLNEMDTSTLKEIIKRLETSIQNARDDKNLLTE